MEKEGKVIAKLQEATGQGTNGTWRRSGFVIETKEMYPKKIALTLFNDKVDLLNNLYAGTEVRAAFSIDSREHNGRWYTELRCYSITVLQQPQMQQESEKEIADEEMGNDLPF